MSIREVDLAQFHEFAREQIQTGRGDFSLTDLAEQWERRVKLTASSAFLQHPNAKVAKARAHVEELARQQGVVPIRSAEDVRFGFLDSRDEFDDFLATVNAGRHEVDTRDPLND